MASRLDRILEGPPRGDVDATRMEAPKEGPGGSHRPRADTPPAPKAGSQAKPQATGPLTSGRAAASKKGETGRKSASPSDR